MVQKLISRLFVLIIFISIASPIFAQKNELAVTVGGYLPADSGNAFVIGGNFAHRLASVPLVSVYLEIPVFSTFNSTAHVLPPPPLGNPKYSALFVTPGIKLKLAPGFFLSPYFAVGGGVVHFSKSNVITDDSTYTGAFDFGGGLDLKIAPFLSARGEVRDFYSGGPDLIPGFNESQHQIITSVGLVLRF
jgi:hypothetical protein